MSRLPWTKWYFADWYQDTRTLSFELKGIWIDLIGLAWKSPEPGIKRFTNAEFKDFLGALHLQSSAIFLQLSSSGVADFSMDEEGNITVVCRRIVREKQKQKQGLSRYHKWKEKKNSGANAGLTQEKREINRKKLEAKKLEANNTNDDENNKRFTNAELTPRPEAWKLASDFEAFANQRFPERRRLGHADLTESAMEITRLNVLDGVSYERIKEVFEWCSHDRFWSTVVQDGKGLRKNWSKIVAKMQSSGSTDEGIAKFLEDQNNDDDDEA